MNLKRSDGSRLFLHCLSSFLLFLFSVLISLEYHGAAGRTVTLRVESGAWQSSILDSSELYNSTLWETSTKSTDNSEDVSILSRNASLLTDLRLSRRERFCAKLFGVARSPALHPYRDLLIFARSYSGLLGVARSPALHPNRDLLIFARSYSKLLGVAQSCELHPYRDLFIFSQSYSELLRATLLLSVAPPSAYRGLLRFAKRKRYLTNPTRNVPIRTFYKAKTSRLEKIVKAGQMC